MARTVFLSNGSLSVGLNENGLVDDIYYPYVGLENLKTARLIPHQIGVYVDRTFAWVDSSWQREIVYESDAMISAVRLVNSSLSIELKFTDIVDSQEDVFMRLVTVINKAPTKRQVKIFFHQVFQLSKDGHADTAFYEPEDNYIFDYKGHTAIIAYSQVAGVAFNEFAVGNYGIEGKSGTYQDAEDGQLSGNLVEHGGVDSVIAHTLELEDNASAEIEYWLALGASQQETSRVHEIIKAGGIKSRLDTTRNYWRNWLQTATNALPEHLDQLTTSGLYSSLFFIKAHIDKRGAIIASGDSSLYNYGRDYYGYCWPRDGAYAVWPLIKLGYKEEATKFFDFCIKVMHPDGYLQHKFQADGAYGSTWHPLMQEHHKELAIQEDETAIVLYMIAEYVEQSKDEDYFINIYTKFIKPCMDFMTNYIDDTTGLPHPSYELWEQKFLSSTYTAFLVSSTLRRISKLAGDIMKDQGIGRYIATAERIDGNMSKLYDQEKQYFIKGLKQLKNGDIYYDKTLDVSSAYGAFMFGGEVRDSFALAQTVSALESEIIAKTPNGGVARYVDDNYLRANSDLPGNPWFVCTYWLIQYYHYRKETAKRDELLAWTEAHKLKSGMMSEQIDPETGKQIGVGPLVWSHAEHINTILDINS